MTNEYVICPACGLEVPDGRFCKFCGKPLHPEIDHEHESTTETASLELDESLEMRSQEGVTAKFDFTIQGMSSRDQSLLLSKVELAVLAKELDVLIEQIRATRQALQLEHADKSKIVARAESLRRVLEQTKSRRRELLAVKGKLELEDTLVVLDEKKSKLAMLEDLSGSIEQDVYDEKHKELQESIKIRTSILKKQKKQAKDWIKAMEKKIKGFEKEISRLTAQHKIGDISTSRFKKSKTRVTRSISILNGGCKILQDLIEQSETLQSKK
jgi:hypothetical protein